MRSPISAKEVLEVLQGTGLDPSILSEHDPRWGRLRSGVERRVNVRDRYRGALIGGAIGDAMGRPNEGLSPILVHPGRPLLRTCARQVQPSDPSLGSRRGSSDMERA